MTETAVKKILKDDPDHEKEIRLDDGRKFRVRGVEDWATSANHLTVVDGGEFTYFAYRKIASIRLIRRRKAQ